MPPLFSAYVTVFPDTGQEEPATQGSSGLTAPHTPVPPDAQALSLSVTCLLNDESIKLLAQSWFVEVGRERGHSTDLGSLL